MTEETQKETEKVLSLEEKLQRFLEENNCNLTVGCFAPKGGVVAAENFIPDGWLVRILIQKN